MGLECWKQMPYKVRLPVSKSIYVKMDRNTLPSANHGLSTGKPRHGHADCTLWVLLVSCPDHTSHKENIFLMTGVV